MAGSENGKRSWKFYLKYFIFLIVLLFFAGEITVRFMGYTAWEKPSQSFRTASGESYFEPDALLGYRGKPGAFEAILADSLHFNVLHGADGWRISQPANFLDTLKRKEVWVLGCSFTHGFGVEDSATYVWKLQEQFPNVRFLNFGMDGYGTSQNLLLFKQLLKENRPLPALVMLAYGGFHNQRNTSNMYWRKVLSGREVANGLRYPHYRFAPDADTLQLGYSQLEYSPFPLMQWSALMHFAEMKRNNAEDSQLQSRRVTEYLISMMREKCREKAIPMLIAGIYRHPDTHQMLGQFENDEIISVHDFSQDHDDPKLRILPSDGHPNAMGHGLIAQEIADFIRENMSWLETM